MSLVERGAARVGLVAALLAASVAAAGELTGRAGPYHIVLSVSPEPPVVGRNELTLVIHRGAGTAQPDAVSVRATSAAYPAGAMEVAAAPFDDQGGWLAALDIPVRGRWQFEVQIQAGGRSHRTTFTLTTGNPLHQPPAAGVRRVWLWALALVLAPLLVRLLPTRLVPHDRRGVATGVLMLLAGLFLVRNIVATYRKPGQMDVIEAQAMDMTLMVPPVGVVPVVVEEVDEAAFTGGVSYTGSVVPYNEQEVKPRVTGWIVAMPVYPGDAVRRGQVVAQLDTAELSAREREAMMAHAAAVEQAGAARAEANQARAAVTQARAELQIAEQRVAELQSDLGGAEAGLRRSQADAGKSRAMLAEARSQLAAARAARRTATAMSEESREGVALAEAGRSTGGEMVRQAEAELEAAERAVAEAVRGVEAAQAARERAEAGLTTAEAELPRAQAEVASAQADLGYWDAEIRRMASLLADGAVSQDEYDREKAQRDQSAARLEQAKTDVKAVQGRIAAARAEVREAEAASGAAVERRAAAEAGVRAARAKIAQAQSDLEARRAGVAQQQAGVRSRAAMEDEADSMIAMREAQVARAEAEVTAAEAAIEEANQALAGRRAALAQARSDVDRARAALAAAEAAARAAAGRAAGAAADAAKEQAAAAAAGTVRSYTTIVSHLDGVVTERPTAPPTLVDPGTVLLRIAEIDRVRLQAPVAAADAAQILPGADVEVVPQKDPGRRLRTKVSAVFPAADPTSRTTVVEAVIANADRFLLPGDYVTMRIRTVAARARAVTVPNDAIVQVTAEPGQIYGATRPAVWTVLGGGGEGRTEYYCTMHPEVVSDKPGICPKCKMDLVPRQVGGGEGRTEYYCTMHPEVVSDKPGICPKCKMDLVPRQVGGGGGTAHLVRVTTGRRDADRTEITAGLKPGDRVIVRGFEGLKEGDRVMPVSGHETPVPPLGSVTHEPRGASGKPPASGLHGGH